MGTDIHILEVLDLGEPAIYRGFKDHLDKQWGAGHLPASIARAHEYLALDDEDQQHSAFRTFRGLLEFRSYDLFRSLFGVRGLEHGRPIYGELWDVEALRFWREFAAARKRTDLTSVGYHDYRIFPLFDVGKLAARPHSWAPRWAHLWEDAVTTYLARADAVELSPDTVVVVAFDS